MDICSLITGFIFGLIGSFFGALFAHSFSECRRKRESFNKAAVDFQNAFLEAKQRLRDDPRADWYKILNSNVLLEHEKAAMRFKLFLSEDERTAFEQDWQIYFTHTLHPGDRHAPEKTLQEWGDEDNCKIFIEQIEKLLSYAKLK